MDFLDQLVKKNKIPDENPLVRYLKHKTRAVDRGSKARRSLGSLYALLVLAEDYLEGTTSRFTDLMARMKKLPFGSKLQNHPLDNRLNDEFGRQMDVEGEYLPVQAISVEGKKGRIISEHLLAHSGADPKRVAAFIVEVIHAYIELITEKQESVL